MPIRSLPFLFLAATATAQAALGDLVTTTSTQFSGNVSRFVPLGGQALFAANNVFGIEAWVTDGTSPGTRQLADLMPAGNASPSALVAFGGVWLFAATVPGFGRELWRTDGTLAGTQLLCDTWPGESSGNPANTTLFGGQVWFAADDGVSGAELWRSDGTTLGTARFADLAPGSGSSFPSRFTVAGGWLWFTANDGATGTELWRTDGTLANTQRVADLTPGSASTAFTALAAFGSGVVFAANAGVGTEPYASDGTPAGTVLLADLRPGSLSSSPADFTVLGSQVLFAADGATGGRELFRTDGTPAGTALVLDVNPGTPGSSPAEFALLGGAVVFAATTSSGGREPWRSDGTAPGTYALGDLLPGSSSSNPAGFAAVGSDLWFAADGSGIGRELWRTDGTPAGTTLLADLQPGLTGADPRAITAFLGGALLSAAIGGAAEPHFRDAVTGTTVLLRDVATTQADAHPGTWANLGSDVFFAAGGEGLGQEPFRTGGTAATTVPIADLVPGTNGSNTTAAVGVGNRVFFAAQDAGGGRQLFVTDGTATTQLTFGLPGPTPRDLVAFGTGVLFTAETAVDRELWVSDGTPAGTFELLEIHATAPAFGSSSALFTVVGGAVFFVADDGVHGFEPWVTDGTAAGTHLVADLEPGPTGSAPAWLVAWNGWLWFAATDAVAGTELWRSDGTPANTQRVADLAAGSAGSAPQQLTVAGDRLFFTASVAGQRELHVCDAALAVAPVTTTAFGRTTAYSDLRGTRGGLFFLHDDRAGFGKEVWHSDGTAAGTLRVADVVPGQRSGPVPGTLVPVFDGTQLFFAVGEHDRGLQFWVTDGAAAGTRRVSNFGTPGSGLGFAAAQTFFATGERLFFSGSDGTTGFEPWVLDAEASALAVARPYGVACTGSNGAPRIGANGAPWLGNGGFAITLTQAMPNSITLLTASFAAIDVLFDGCHLLVNLPFTIWSNPLTDAAGTAFGPFPVPLDPTMLGDDLFFQYGVVDPLGTVLGFLTLSDGLRLQLGS
ncbi:MAG: hypothetical protein JNL08_00100 [Planctomycetes bacterium]|nr:hypothetical protein [Planctomycetota bacterium]